MLVYRIVQKKARTKDLSGTGAYLNGGRWNNVGTYMLYTSENRSLAMLEVVVHADADLMPPDMYIMEIEIHKDAPLYTWPLASLPKRWREAENLALKGLGDDMMRQLTHLGIIVPSAVVPKEHNILLNPLFPGYHDMVKVTAVDLLKPDARLFI